MVPETNAFVHLVFIANGTLYSHVIVNVEGVGGGIALSRVTRQHFTVSTVG